MTKCKFIVNPSSGRQTADAKIDRIIYLLHSHGYKVERNYTYYGGHAMEMVMEAQDAELIIVSGGDGTVNEVVQGMMRTKSRAKLAILSQGTVNDFAGFMQLPRHPDEFFQMIAKGNTLQTDVGCWNDHYFINVAAAGLLTEIAYEVDDDLKAIWGRAAYYAEGARRLLSELTNPSPPIRFQITSKEFTGEVDALVMLISNSKSVGGIKRIAPLAEVNDGLFDVLIVKATNYAELGPVMITSIAGQHIKQDPILYFKTSELSVVADQPLYVDLDGEKGDPLPGHFKVLPGAINLCVPAKEDV